MVTDQWPGIDHFFVPNREILVASSAEEIVNHLRKHSAEDCRLIGHAMRRRACLEHTYELRVKKVDHVLREAQQKTTAA